MDEYLFTNDQRSITVLMWKKNTRN